MQRWRHGRAEQVGSSLYNLLSLSLVSHSLCMYLRIYILTSRAGRFNHARCCQSLLALRLLSTTRSHTFAPSFISGGRSRSSSATRVVRPVRAFACFACLACLVCLAFAVKYSLVLTFVSCSVLYSTLLYQWRPQPLFVCTLARCAQSGRRRQWCSLRSAAVAVNQQRQWRASAWWLWW
jgi:hypothetical protein